MSEIPLRSEVKEGDEKDQIELISRNSPKSSQSIVTINSESSTEEDDDYVFVKQGFFLIDFIFSVVFCWAYLSDIIITGLLFSATHEQFALIFIVAILSPYAVTLLFFSPSLVQYVEQEGEDTRVLYGRFYLWFILYLIFGLPVMIITDAVMLLGSLFWKPDGYLGLYRFLRLVIHALCFLVLMGFELYLVARTQDGEQYGVPVELFVTSVIGKLVTIIAAVFCVKPLIILSNVLPARHSEMVESRMNFVSADVANKFFSELKKNTKLHTLRLTDGVITNNQLDVICEILETKHTVLNFEFARIKGCDWETLFDSIGKNTSIQNLWVHENGLDDDQAKLVADAAVKNKRILRIRMHHNEYKMKGICMFLARLRNRRAPLLLVSMHSTRNEDLDEDFEEDALEEDDLPDNSPNIIASKKYDRLAVLLESTSIKELTLDEELMPLAGDKMKPAVKWRKSSERETGAQRLRFAIGLGVIVFFGVMTLWAYWHYTSRDIVIDILEETGVEVLLRSDGILSTLLTSAPIICNMNRVKYQIGDISLDPSAFSQTDELFLFYLENFPVDGILMGTETGAFTGVFNKSGEVYVLTREPDAGGENATSNCWEKISLSDGIRGEVIDDCVIDIDVRDRIWYTGSGWTPFYEFVGSEEIGFTFSMPVYDKDGNGSLVGVFAVDFGFAEVSDQLSTLRIPYGGLMYITDRDYRIVAISVDEYSLNLENVTIEADNDLLDATLNWFKEQEIKDSKYSFKNMEGYIAPFQIGGEYLTTAAVVNDDLITVVSFHREAFLFEIRRADIINLFLGVITVTLAAALAYFSYRVKPAQSKVHIDEYMRQHTHREERIPLKKESTLYHARKTARSVITKGEQLISTEFMNANMRTFLIAVQTYTLILVISLILVWGVWEFMTQKAVTSINEALMKEGVNVLINDVEKYLVYPPVIVALNHDHFSKSLPTIDPGISESSYDQYFSGILDSFRSLDETVLVRHVYMGLETGEMIGCQYDEINDTLIITARDTASSNCYTKYYATSDGQRDVDRIWVEPDCDYDPTKRPWYIQGKEYPEDKQLWSSAYTFTGTSKVGITATRKVHEPDGVLVGIVAVDIWSEDLTNVLQYICPDTIVRDLCEHLQNAGEDQARAYIVERNGELIAASHGNISQVIVGDQGDKITKIVHSTELNDPHISSSANYLSNTEHTVNFETIKEPKEVIRSFQDPRAFLYPLPTTGEDWIFVGLAPNELFSRDWSTQGFLFGIGVIIVIVYLISVTFRAWRKTAKTDEFTETLNNVGAAGAGDLKILNEHMDRIRECVYSASKRAENPWLGQALFKQLKETDPTAEASDYKNNGRWDIQRLQSSHKKNKSSVWNQDLSPKSTLKRATHEDTMKKRKEFRFRRAVDHIQQSRHGRNILTICQLEEISRTAVRLYKVHTFWLFRWILMLVICLHAGLAFYEPVSNEELASKGYSPAVIGIEIVFLLYELADAIMWIIVYSYYETDNVLCPKSAKTVNSVRLVLITAILVDWLLTVGYNFSFEYHFPIRPLLVITASERVRASAFAFFSTMFDASNIFVLYFVVIMQAALMGMLLFRRFLNVGQVESSFDNFVRSVITSFVFLSSGENFGDVVFAAFHQNVWYSFYFIVLTIVGIFFMSSIVIGIFENGFTQLQKTQIMKNKLFKRTGIIAAFILIDNDNSGTVDEDEFMTFMKYVRNIDLKPQEDENGDDMRESDEIHAEKQIRTIFAKLNKSTPVTRATRELKSVMDRLEDEQDITNALPELARILAELKQKKIKLEREETKERAELKEAHIERQNSLRGDSITHAGSVALREKASSYAAAKARNAGADDVLDVAEFVDGIELYSTERLFTKSRDWHSYPRLKSFRDNVLDTRAFEKGILLLIMIQIWVAAHYGIYEENLSLDLVLFGFLLFQFAEVWIKFGVHGRKEYLYCAYYERKNYGLYAMYAYRFEFFIVNLSFVITMIGIFIVGTLDLDDVEDGDIWRLFMILPTLRIFVQVKTIRRLVFLLYIIIPSFVYLFALMLVVLYIFAMFGMTLFHGKFSVLPNGTPDANFDTFEESCLTLFQLLIGEGWQEVMYNAVLATSYFGNAWYFIMYEVFMTLLFVNLFIGIMLSTFQFLIKIKKTEITELDLARALES